MKKKEKNIWFYLLLCFGLALMIVGLVFLFSSENHCGHAGGLSRASTSVEYGADFYTDSVQATALAANAITDVYKILKNAIGIFFLFIGGVESCAVLWIGQLFSHKERKAEEKKESQLPNGEEQFILPIEE